MGCPWAASSFGEEVLVKKGRRKVGEGERSRVGLLLGLCLGLCLGLMAWSIRPRPSFSITFYPTGALTPTCLLDVFVNVITPCRGVWDIIMGNKVNLRDQRGETEAMIFWSRRSGWILWTYGKNDEDVKTVSPDSYFVANGFWEGVTKPTELSTYTQT
ncbi:hypothetical protein JZ751_014258 [Albula glossodonta]|uniref:Uncharacterized protein n=1 Tax=Albula glossodonta TaxID=121402 RepID=A0A8T2P3R2_9TELE|nr:hypothetical protein JZ751_014258 [Albula glossodonta]